MRLNKVNLCWVLSEGRKGHEIQSMSLAQRLAQNITVHQFVLQQPWESFTPRIIAGFQYGLKWQGRKPDFNHPPGIIITTGKKAAGVGKFITQKLKKNSIQAKHIQILSPGDNIKNYDLLLVPEHDQKKGINIISFKGSLHQFSPSWFKQMKQPNNNDSGSLAVIIGNPPINYFKRGFNEDIKNIRELYPNESISICGSPRLSNKFKDTIKKTLTPNDTFWFNCDDGTNPYQTLLQQAKHIFVTADSINMMNECASTNMPVTLLAKTFILSKKHHRFIDSMTQRWQEFNSSHGKAISPISYTLDEVLHDIRFQKLLNSPFSSNDG